MGVYKWKPFVSVGVDAQVAGEELERLVDEHGGNITPQIVVIAATKKRSPLHPAFEWDDKEAARKHREDQARYLLRSIVVVTNEGAPEDEEVKTIRAFVHLQSEEAYVTIVRALSDSELRQELVGRAWKELNDWTKRYEELQEFARVVAVIKSENVA